MAAQSKEEQKHTNKRLKDMTVSKPIVVGSISTSIGKKNQKEQLFMYT